MKLDSALEFTCIFLFVNLISLYADKQLKQGLSVRGLSANGLHILKYIVLAGIFFALAYAVFRIVHPNVSITEGLTATEGLTEGLDSVGLTQDCQAATDYGKSVSDGVITGTLLNPEKEVLKCAGIANPITFTNKLKMRNQIVEDADTYAKNVCQNPPLASWTPAPANYMDDFNSQVKNVVSNYISDNNLATCGPATTKPITTKPAATTKAATTKPITTKPTTKPITTKPITTKPITTKPTTSAPTTSAPTTDAITATGPTTSPPATTLDLTAI